MPPKPCVRKPKLEHWLRENSVPFNSSMYKPQLSKLISLCKDRLNRPTVQQMFKDANVPVLPSPHQPDLNPMDEVWALAEDLVAMQNVRFERKMANEVIRCRLEEVQNTCEFFEIFGKTKQIEEEYMKSDRNIDELTDRIVLRGLDSSDSESDTTRGL
ncbi:uncharacterized protein [Battus philenor]|uniref:uncharacterized protein n=1 Tax=Battus philenor TaxID=42288 RepID=UPI0035CFE635